MKFNLLLHHTSSGLVDFFRAQRSDPQQARAGLMPSSEKPATSIRCQLILPLLSGLHLCTVGFTTLRRKDKASSF